MSDTLFLRLQPAPPGGSAADGLLECCVAGPAGVGGAERVPLAALAARAEGHRVVAFVPAADTLGVAVTMPPMSAAKLRAALPFALEDQLAGDLEDQHFALGARLADGRWPVRVIARRRLDEWLATLRGAGIEPQAIIAEADGLRDKPGDMMLWLDGDEAHWRAPGQAPVSLPADLLADGPTLAAGGTPLGALGLRVHATADDQARHAAALEAIGGRFLQVAVQTLPQGALPWLADGFDAARAVNLLQGPYAPSRTAASGTDVWRWPLRLAAAVVALQIVGWGLELWRLHRAAAPVDSALLQAARPIDPKVADAEAARDLLRTRLADWDRREREPSGAPLVAALAALADARAAAPTVQLSAVQQQEGGAVTARLATADALALQAARDALLASGWTLSAETAAEITVTRGPKP